MRFLVVVTPKHPAPPDRVLQMIDGLEAWHDRHSDKFESFGLFPGGGGYGVVEIGDEASLHRIIAENPFTPFANTEIRVAVDGPTGIQNAREVMAAMLQA